MLPIEDIKFHFEHTQEGDQTIVRLSGSIDEDAKFDELMSLGKKMVFNFKEVTSINSCGIRNWVNFIKELDAVIYYAECPPVIVRQLNMVPSFKGKADVVSVEIPYVCDACEKEKVVLVHKDKFQGGNVQVSELITCDACGKEEMEFDGHPEQYFAFAK